MKFAKISKQHFLFLLLSVFGQTAVAQPFAELDALWSDGWPLFYPERLNKLIPNDAPVRALDSCGLTGSRINESFLSYVKRHYGLNPFALDDSQTRIEHVAQYYREANDYYHISGTRDVAPTLAYRLDSFAIVSDNGTQKFERHVTDVFDSERFHSIEGFFAAVAKLKAKGTKLGARVTTVTAQPPDERQSTISLRLVNQFPVSFESSQNVCRYNFETKTFDCTCPTPDDHSHALNESIDYSPQTSANEGETEISFTPNIDTLFKKSTTESTSLPNSQKCAIKRGEKIVLTKAPTVATGKHYAVELQQSKTGCEFTKGYIYGPHVRFQGFEPPMYTFPVPNGIYTSSWCVCRSIGSSPHIGQDIGLRTTNTSVALGEGVIEDIVFSESCGYSVHLRDKGNARWRYLHLNKPIVEVGQTVKRGDKIGKHSSYPKASCGTGPHLHLERLSPGIFADNEKIRTCDSSGPKSCNYDPILPFRSLTNVTVNASAKNFEFSTLAAACSSSQPVAVETELDKNVLRPQNGGTFVVNQNNHIEFTHQMGNLKQWKLFVRNIKKRNTNGYLLLASGSSLYNPSALISDEARYCLPSNADKEYVLSYRDNTDKVGQIVGRIIRRERN